MTRTITQPAPRGLVVELCGLPGAGKTTLAAEVVRQLNDSGQAAEVADAPVTADISRQRRLLRKAALVATTVALSPAEAVRGVRYLGAGQQAARDRVAVPVKWVVATRVVAKAQARPCVSVLEEGLVQALWTARLRGSSRYATDIRRLLEERAGSPSPDLVVHLDVPVDVALERLRGRASLHSRVQRLDESEQVDAMGYGDWLLRRLLSEWMDLSVGPVLTLRPDPSDKTGVAAASLVAHLGRMRGPDPERTGSWLHGG